MQYTQEQVMLTLSLLSYLGFSETQWSKQDSRRTYTWLLEGLAKTPPVAGKWTLVWGPAVHALPLTIFDQNMMFVARSNEDPSQYAIVIRGTNPLSLTNWLLEDFDVIVQTPWPYAQLAGQGVPKLSKGSARGLQSLQSITPVSGLPGSGMSLYQFLAEEVRKNPSSRLSVTVTGHSLAGALSPTVALWLADTQVASDDPESPPWDPMQKSTLRVVSFAGPSPGNKDFALYYDRRLGATTRRFWNAFDVVPHGWVESALKGLPKLYLPNVAPGTLMGIVLWSALALSRRGNYCHVASEAPALGGGQVSRLFSDYVGQMLYQHSLAYVELMGLWGELDMPKHLQSTRPVAQGARMAGAAPEVTEPERTERAARNIRSGVPGAMLRLEPERPSTLARGAHNLLRVPATLMMSMLPQSLALSKLRKRQAHYQVREQAPERRVQLGAS